MAGKASRPGSALLVIDLQCGMFDGNQIEPIHDGGHLLERAKSAIDQARRVGSKVLFVRHGGDAGHLLETGSEAWQVHPALDPQAGDTIIDKHMPDAFHETQLAIALADAGVRRLAILGAQSEICVDTTCRRARGLGFDVALVADGHSTWDNATLPAEQIIRHTNETLASWFATLIATHDVGSWLGGSGGG